MDILIYKNLIYGISQGTSKHVLNPGGQVVSVQSSESLVQETIVNVKLMIEIRAIFFIKKRYRLIICCRKNTTVNVNE